MYSNKKKGYFYIVNAKLINKKYKNKNLLASFTKYFRTNSYKSRTHNLIANK